MADKQALATFLAAVHGVHVSGSGTKETSFYTAIDNLLDGIGGALKPKVHCVMQLKSLGAGNPDGGLFTADQFERDVDAPKNPLTPARGVIEVKAPAEALDFTLATAQVAKYWGRYRLVLVTNLRDWLLIGERDGQRVPLERYTLAATAEAFWKLAAEPTQVQQQRGPAFADFLARVMLQAAPLSEPKDLAWLLASYAREAANRIELAPAAAQQQLAVLEQGLEAALGVSFDAKDGAHFFRSTLVQTLFYGIFAAWVLRHQAGATGKFDWKTAAYDLNVPMISALFEQLSQPTKLKALDLTAVLDWAADALNRVDQTNFFKKFEARQSVQYFYEPFLEAFDPALRKQLGVWYTPREIVQYQVARVDHALRTELGIAEGLSDPQVVVLDPCCGTGAYLVEVLDLIAQRLAAQGNAALAGHELKRAMQERIFGFELLPAPYVVAHLQLGLLLQQLSAPLQTRADGSGERVGVYLTNALTGWEPLKDPKSQVLPFPELAAERDAANSVKRGQKVLVILGNPPYNGYAGVAIGEERELSDAYRKAAAGPQPQGRGLNELYVRFFRMAERQIVEHTGRGIVSFISNSSWLDGLSHPAMRERFLQVFDHIRIDDLQGDKYRTGKLTPTGEPDPSAFSTAQNREGIQVGTAIATLVRRAQPMHAAVVEQREWWGRRKLADLAQASADLDAPAHAYQAVVPRQALGWAFGVRATSASYLAWPTLPELLPTSYPGIKTSRDAALVDIDRGALEARMRRYFDPAVSDGTIAEEMPELMRAAARFDPFATRKRLLSLGFDSGRVLRHAYRPFDVRWLYWHAETKLLDEKRPDYVPQVFEGNPWLFTTGRTRKGEPEPAFTTQTATDLNLQDSGARGIPLFVRVERDDLLGASSSPQANLSKAATRYLEGVGAAPEDLFFHALAILHSDAYREANAGALRQDWPRIPLPATLGVLHASAALGREVAALLDTETPVPGVTSGTPPAALRLIAAPARTDGLPLGVADFALTAGWGHAGQGGVTMPGKGRVADRAVSAEEAAGGLGPATHDVYLNAHACWRHVPAPVWNYTLGGYQVLKKWLSYREQVLLGRALTFDEVKTFTSIARRIAALLLLRDRLDANYQASARAEASRPPVITGPAAAAPGAPAQGDRVLFAKYSGSEVLVEGVEDLILSEQDILSIIEGGSQATGVPDAPPADESFAGTPDLPRSDPDPHAALLNDPRNVPLWFGTNREPVDRGDVGRGFTGRRSSDRSVWHGRCIVNVPQGHALGSTGTGGPKGWWQRWWHGTDDRLNLLSVEGLGEPDFWQAVRAALGEPDDRKPEALLFLHGYRVTFEKAALRAAQLAYDLKIRDTAFFSWPSAGAFAQYIVDEGSAKNATEPLAEFISTLDASAHAAGKALHVIAHSMGNRVLLAALQWLVLKGRAPQAIDKIVCAAPDEDAADFVAAMATLRAVGKRRTLYASSKDKPVWLSEVVHGYPRAGCIPPVTLADGLDTVDASDLEATFLGHSDFATERPLLQDLFSLIKASLEPQERLGLERALTDAGAAYWRIK
jgi:esterase/lipase superfamily enzyme